MVDASGMNADVYDDPLDTSDLVTINRFSDIGIDSQFQYLHDSNTVTVQLAYLRDRHRYPALLANQAGEDANGNPLPDTNSTDTTRVLRAKASYVCEARHGVSLSWFKQNGTTNSPRYDPARVYGNISECPGITGETPEAFWTPLQVSCFGARCTLDDRYHGTLRNDGSQGRNPGDNNSLFPNVWMAC